MLGDYEAAVRDLAEVQSEPLENEREEHRTNADEDLRELVRYLKGARKRRAATEWSVPNEVPLIALAPDYYSMPRNRTWGLGSVGQQDSAGMVRDE